MAHYDCNDCGASMGISYGLCPDCTPDDVRKAKAKMLSNYSIIRQEVYEEFEDKISKKVNRLMKKERADYTRLFEAGKPKR
jgi:hypothetical protein